MRRTTGGVYERRGVQHLRVTIESGKRASVALPWATRATAIERARLVQALVDRIRTAGYSEMIPKVLEDAAEADPSRLSLAEKVVDTLLGGRAVAPANPSGPKTIRTFAREWTSGALAAANPDHVKPKKDVTDDVRWFERYIHPVIGDRPIASITLDHCDAVMKALPAKLGPASRRHVAQALHRLLGLAVYPAKLIAASPIPKGWLPGLGKKVAFTFLYPDEDRALLSHVATPLEWRLFFGVLAREGLRREELALLTWSDLDLARGLISLDENKTDDPRTWHLDPGVTRALARWKAIRRGAPNERVFGGRKGLYVAQSADRLRRALKSAGIERVALYARSPKRRPLRVHDLRATFVTVSLAAGKSETWVSDRTGHRSSIMIHRYKRAARTWVEAGIGTLAPLDEAVAWDESPPSRGGADGGNTSTNT